MLSGEGLFAEAFNTRVFDRFLLCDLTYSAFAPPD